MKALSGAAWLAAGRVLGDALAFGLFVLIAREFGPVGTGLYFFTFAIATVFYELVSLGIDEYGVRECARRRDGRGRLIGELLGAQLALGAATAGIVLVVGAAFGEVHGLLLAFMLTYQLAFALARTLFIPAFVAGRVSIQVAAETAIRAAVLAVAAFVVFGAAGEPSLVAALIGFPVFGALLVAVAFVLASRFTRDLRPRFAFGALPRVLAALWPFAAANVVSGLYTRTAIVALFVAAGGLETGLFSSAYKFAEVGWALLALLPWAGYPWLARAMDGGREEFGALSASLLRATLLCGGALAWGMYWIVPYVSHALLGAEFDAAAPLVRAFAAFVAVLAVNEYLERILLVAELQGMRLRILGGQAALNALLVVLLVPRYGAGGAVAAFVASQLIAVPAYLSALRSRIALGDTLRAIAVYAFALCGAYASVALPARYLSGSWLAPVLSLAVFTLIARAGGLLRLASPEGATESQHAWGR